MALKVELGFPNGVRRRFKTQKLAASQLIQKYNKTRQYIVYFIYIIILLIVFIFSRKYYAHRVCCIDIHIAL